MNWALLFALGTTLMQLSVIKSGASDHLLAKFEALSLKCQGEWSIEDKQEMGSGLLISATQCLSSRSSPKCIGIKCNSSICSMVQQPSSRPFRCIKNFNFDDHAEEKLFLISEFSQRPELALVDLSEGKLELVTLNGISPISIPKLEPTRLQVQVGKDILACSEDSQECKIWMERTNQWTMFPPLNSSHSGGTMTLVGNKIVVIGGNSTTSTVNEIVEIYDPITHRWTSGPPILPARTLHTTVAFNETSLIVIGGLNDTDVLESVKLFNVQAMTWSDVADYPFPIYGTACGIIKGNTVLCIGGKKPWLMIKDAYEIRMSSNSPTWKKEDKYEAKRPVFDGFLYSMRCFLYSMTISNSDIAHSPSLSRLNLTEENPTWNAIPLSPNLTFTHVSPYIIDGYIFAK